MNRKNSDIWWFCKLFTLAFILNTLGIRQSYALYFPIFHYSMTVTEAVSLGDGWYSGRDKTRQNPIIDALVSLHFDRLHINADDLSVEDRVASQETLQAWERFKAIVYTADGIGGGATLAQSITRGLAKVQSWDELLATFSKNKNHLRGNAGTIYDKVVKGGKAVDGTGMALKNGGWSDDLVKEFESTFNGTKTIENAQSWQLLRDANRTGLMKNADAVEALTRVRANPQLQKLGFIDELLAKVKASRLEDGAFKNILDDLDNFGEALEKHPIEFENFKSIISKLTDNNPQNSQAAQWIIQDITQNANEFTGKKWKFEQVVVNSQNNNSYIDLAALDNSKYIEYKWITSGMVNKADFLNQFVKRDLFNKNLTSLSQLEWRIKGNKLSKEKVLEYLSSKEGREMLKDEKIRKLFEDFGRLNNSKIRIRNVEDLLDFLELNNEWYNIIFK